MLDDRIRNTVPCKRVMRVSLPLLCLWKCTEGWIDAGRAGKDRRLGFRPSTSLMSVRPPNPSSSQTTATTSDPSPNPGRFSRIPSWVSLSSPPSPLGPLRTTQRHGHVENLHLISLSKQGKFEEAREFLNHMEAARVSVSPLAYKHLLEDCGKCGSLLDGRRIHKRMQNSGMDPPPGFLGDSVLRMYCGFGCLTEARKVFDDLPDKGIASWDSIVSAHALNGDLYGAFGLFSDMLSAGARPNSSIYKHLLSCVVDAFDFETGRQMHSLLIKCGFGLDARIGSGICNMYVKCGWLEGARFIVDQMVEKNVVASTTLMAGYTGAGEYEDALRLYDRMIREDGDADEFVFSVVLKACAGLKDMRAGRQVHGQIAKLGLETKVSVGTPLVDLYTKCEYYESASLAFRVITEPNDVSWSALISGYCQSGKFYESLRSFASLRSKSKNLNYFTYTSVFQACSAITDAYFGMQAHADAIKRGSISPLHGESALITMYSKCGKMDDAAQVFESIEQTDMVAWTAIISGLAHHGNASEALSHFRRMQHQGVRPNAVTFIAVLTACSHSSLITEAECYLNSMSSSYGVRPTIDHYNCLIDVYSRAGLLQKAYELIAAMPFEPDTMSWKCLLAGCWNHKNLELGRMASEKLLHLDPDDTAGYVLMFNLCSSSGRWAEAADIRRKMSERNLRKELSCSWITVKGKVHRFIVGDRHHPQMEEIYSKLEEIGFSAGRRHTVGSTDGEDILAERNDQLLVHSERLAVAFGLISTPSNAPVLIFKNLRACKDCHDFAKYVSLTSRREITIRDTSRFHRFRLGECSCRDYW